MPLAVHFMPTVPIKKQEDAMMVDEGRRAGDERKGLIDIIEHHHMKLVSHERHHDGQLETPNLERAGCGERGCI